MLKHPLCTLMCALITLATLGAGDLGAAVPVPSAKGEAVGQMTRQDNGAQCAAGSMSACARLAVMWASGDGGPVDVE